MSEWKMFSGPAGLRGTSRKLPQRQGVGLCALFLDDRVYTLQSCRQAHPGLVSGFLYGQNAMPAKGHSAIFPVHPALNDIGPPAGCEPDAETP